MTWFDAVAQSPLQQAVRTTEKGLLMIRYRTGETVIKMQNGAFRGATAKEADGHGDWEPAK